MSSQELELSAAAEKLAECQETIFVLGKQLNLMRPNPELPGSFSRDKSQKNVECFTEDERTTNNSVDMNEINTVTSADVNQSGGESPVNIYDTPFSPSDSEASNLPRSPISSKHSHHRSAKSGSSTSSSSTATPEKNSRGFSRFFSTKARNDH